MHKPITLHFLKAGLLTMVQDMGRYGYQEFGVPISGALDQQAAKTANWLVGNEYDNPVLEITLLGPKIQIEGPVQIAITGGNISPKLDGIDLPLYETITIGQSALLSFGRIQNGCRAYIAIGGKWIVQSWLGSCSAATSNPTILTPDSIFKKESQLKIIPSSFIDKRNINLIEQPVYKKQTTIRMTIGPEFDNFSKQSIAYFFSQVYQISPDSNRMGYRLLGKDIKFTPTQEVISSGIVPGTIQISNAGLPIILMRDAQTTGGYHRIGNVVESDLDRLAQLKPGDGIRFALI